MIRGLTIFIFGALFTVYFFFSFGTVEQTSVILTIATFLFATFTGFFTARQGARYTEIRNEIANFDGHMSALYRNFTHLGAPAMKKASTIIANHYNAVLKHGGWDYPFTRKTTTLTDLHTLLGSLKTKASANVVMVESIEYIINSLQQLQVSRKKMINLRLERIPEYQWALIVVLGLILLLTVSAVPTVHAVIPSILKAAFGTSILIVIVLLWEFDNLKFFEEGIGRQSAQDILDILKGKK